MASLIPVRKREDIFSEYQNTPVGLLFEYHNLKKDFEVYEKAELLVGMCMDNRKYLHIPDNFAFILRTGGANLRYSDFKVSFAVSIGQVKYIVLIGHTNCGMVNLKSRKKEFINGLVESAGWSAAMAEEHFSQNAPMFEIMNEVDFVISEAVRLHLYYPKIKVVPLLYRVEDNLLYQMKEQ